MPRVQVRSGQLPALSTVQTRRAIRKEELGSNMIATVANKYAQVVWQKDDDGIPEMAILVTNYPGSGLIEIQQGNSAVNVNYESIPELIKTMKTAKGMHD